MLFEKLRKLWEDHPQAAAKVLNPTLQLDAPKYYFPVKLLPSLKMLPLPELFAACLLVTEYP